MSNPQFDQHFWEQLWAKTRVEHADKLARRPPNAHLLAETSGLPPGRALDAGCGHGAEAVWLASRGWRVTALDFSTTALAVGRSLAAAAGAEVAERIEWLQGDLGRWTIQPSGYELVVCLYVHIAGSVTSRVQRLAEGVAPGGTLLLAGHRPIDPETGAQTAAAPQVQVSVESAVAALDSSVWELQVAEERRRASAGSGVDAVIRATRRL